MKLMRTVIVLLLIAIPIAMILFSGTAYIKNGITKINWVIAIPLGIIFGFLLAFLKKQGADNTSSDKN
ncbi:MAG TPA: hypothetical protein VKA34_17850 [Balneolales bacterium]|nr:hypothetical protein [Balneolales bacterium]